MRSAKAETVTDIGAPSLPFPTLKNCVAMPIRSGAPVSSTSAVELSEMLGASTCLRGALAASADGVAAGATTICSRRCIQSVRLLVLSCAAAAAGSISKSASAHVTVREVRISDGPQGDRLIRHISRIRRRGTRHPSKS